MSFSQDLEQRIRASYPCLYVVAREDWRCEREVQKVFASLTDKDMKYRVWTCTSGWREAKENGALSPGDKVTDPLEALRSVMGQAGVFCFVNFHHFFDSPEVQQTVKDLVQVGKLAGQTAVFISNVWKVPQELEDDLTRMEFGLPDKELLSERVDYLLEGVGDKVQRPSDSEKDALLNAALGMTTWEAENSFTLSLVANKRLDPEFVAKEKARAVSKSGILEFYEPGVSMGDVGGLDNLKHWLKERRNAFSKEAREFGLQEPRGIMLVGVPGCGKSLSAKAIAAEWQMPLIRFDLGRLFQGLVGASEENTRRALSVAEAVAPAVLWIDELEKGFSGLSSSGSTDSGVTARVFGTIITWMQERKRPVFMVATANQVWNLPPELLRAGRWDEIFSVDLPSSQERADILKIHLLKRKRDPSKYDVSYLAKEFTPHFSGAELESVVVKGLYAAFAAGRELTDIDLMNAAEQTIPLAVTRKEDIDTLRDWTSKRATPASSATPENITEADTKRRRVIRMTIEEDNADNTTV